MVYLKCRSCGTDFNNRSKYCPSCGKKVKKSTLLPILVLVALLSISAFGFMLFQYFNPTELNKTPKTAAIVDSTTIDETEKTEETEVPVEYKEKVEETKSEAKPASEIADNVQKDVSQVIDESLKKVVTIYTDKSQGSGFLINDKGDILTNAHVVEGATEVTAVDSTDQQYSGAVIGYSTYTDVAIVRVADLAGQAPLALETSTDAAIGEEVIALGSPLGLRNTATLGYITGVNRSFYIGERSYENIYQMSARINEGSSGGPLLSLKTGKAFAINSARLIDDNSVGFSIPIKDIYSLISEWISSPLTEEELYSLFYNDDGNLYYQEEAENGDDVYFDGGDYSDEDTSYYEIPDDWYSSEEEDDSLVEDDLVEEEIYDESYSEDEYVDLYEEESDVDSYEEEEYYDESDDLYIEEDQNVDSGISENDEAYEEYEDYEEYVTDEEQEIVDEETYEDDELESGVEESY